MAFTDRCETVTVSTASATYASGTVAAVSDQLVQVIGFDGGSVTNSSKVELVVNDSVRATYHAPSGVMVNRMFLDEGPYSGKNQTVSVVVTPSSIGQIDLNIYYRYTN